MGAVYVVLLPNKVPSRVLFSGSCDVESLFIQVWKNFSASSATIFGKSELNHSHVIFWSDVEGALGLQKRPFLWFNYAITFSCPEPF